MDNLKLEHIPWETNIRWDEATKSVKREHQSGKSPVISIGGRELVVANLNGKRIPFYRTTGAGGKIETKVGQWYPAAGITEGEDAWINKTNGAELADYYGSSGLRAIGEHLDKHVGDPNAASWIGDIPKVKAEGRQTAFINEMLKHKPPQVTLDADNKMVLSPEGRQQLQENIQDLSEHADKYTQPNQ
jgi:hypothetical protein